DLFVVLAAAGHMDVPFVGHAGIEGGGIERAGFGSGQLVPVAEVDFGDAFVDGIAIARQFEDAANDLHGRARTLKRAGDEMEFGLWTQFFQKYLTNALCLCASVRRQRRVEFAGEAMFDIRFRFAMPREIKFDPRRKPKRHRFWRPRYRARLPLSSPRCDSPHRR